MNIMPDIPLLHGSLVRLEPLSVSHGDDLVVSAEEDRRVAGHKGHLVSSTGPGEPSRNAMG